MHSCARSGPTSLILVLAVFGVAWTSVARQPMTYYWLALTPLIGLVCIITRWNSAPGREGRVRMIVTQALHWGAVLVAMELAFVADVNQMMNADARALFVLTLLALGTFTAGVHVASWQICLVGVIFALGVPAIAWLEQTALLLVLAVAIVAAIAVLLWLHSFKRDEFERSDRECRCPPRLMRSAHCSPRNRGRSAGPSAAAASRKSARSGRWRTTSR